MLNNLQQLTSMPEVTETDTMKLSIQLEQPESPINDSQEAYAVGNQSLVVPEKTVATADGLEKRDRSWFAMSKVPTDLSIQVQDITFYTHKYQLVSRCGYFSRFELEPVKPNSPCDLKINNLPGGSEAFETILRFCYGLPITLNPNNIAAIRCASEFLEMTEVLEDGNLIAKAEAFFTFVVLSSWRNSVTVLKSCESLSPWAENLQIVRRCCDSIAWKISPESPTTTSELSGERWWFEDMATLRIDHFARIVTALTVKGTEPEIIGSCIMQYAEKWLPNVESERGAVGKFNYYTNELQWNVTSGRIQDIDSGQTREQRMLVESLVSILPPQREAVSCKFLLKLLKMATLYSASAALVSELEKRVGMVLEGASVNDLLVPSYAAADQEKFLNSSSFEELTMHNTDVVQRILEYYLLYEQQQQPPPYRGLVAVGKLLDSYLAEIARDPRLPVSKFQALAQTLPENARTCDDGLYRAIDTYLKTHPSLSEHERRRLCKVMDCKKLSQDACAHAAQNDRLPLRTTIQVLFSEQEKLRASVQGVSQTGTADNEVQERSRSATNTEVKALRIEVEKIRVQMAELQRDYSDLQQQDNEKTRRRSSTGWTRGWAKLRKSGLFHVKVDGDEVRERRKSQNQSRRNSLNQRQSLS